MILAEKISFKLFEWQKSKIDVRVEIPRSKAQLFRLNRRLRQLPSLNTQGLICTDYYNSPIVSVFFDNVVNSSRGNHDLI